MSTAQTCKRCPQFDHDRVYCNKYKKQTSKWQDWCDWRKSEWTAWKMAGGSSGGHGEDQV